MILEKETAEKRIAPKGKKKTALFSFFSGRYCPGLDKGMPVINKVTVMKKGAKKVLNSFLCRLTF